MFPRLRLIAQAQNGSQGGGILLTSLIPGLLSLNPSFSKVVPPLPWVLPPLVKGSQDLDITSLIGPFETCLGPPSIKQPNRLTGCDSPNGP